MAFHRKKYCTPIYQHKKLNAKKKYIYIHKGNSFSNGTHQKSCVTHSLHKPKPKHILNKEDIISKTIYSTGQPTAVIFSHSPFPVFIFICVGEELRTSQWEVQSCKGQISVAKTHQLDWRSQALVLILHWLGDDLQVWQTSLLHFSSCMPKDTQKTHTNTITERRQKKRCVTIKEGSKFSGVSIMPDI